MKNVFSSILILSLIYMLSSCNMGHKDMGGEVVCVLEISQPEVLLDLAHRSPDPSFNKAVAMAQQKKDSGSATDFVTLFVQAYAVTAPGAKLSEVFGQSYHMTGPDGKPGLMWSYSPKFKNRIGQSSTNEEVIAAVRAVMKDAARKTAEIIALRFQERPKPAEDIGTLIKKLLKRNKKVEVENEDLPLISALRIINDSTQISVRLTHMIDIGRTTGMLTSRGQLEFWNTYENEELFSYLINADKTLGIVLFAQERAKSTSPPKGKNEVAGFFADAVIASDSNGTGKKVTISIPESAAKDTDLLRYPLLKILMPMWDQQNGVLPGPIIGVALGKDTAQVNTYMKIIGHQFPQDVKFLWGAKPYSKENNMFGLYAIQVNPGVPGPAITGEGLSDIRAGWDQSGNPDITLKMDAAGSHKWSLMTEAASTAKVNGRTTNKCVAIVMDDKVLSAPKVIGKIDGGYTQITGLGTIEEAKDLAGMLNAGSMPAVVKLISIRPAGSQEGK